MYGNTTIEWLSGDPNTRGSYTWNQIDTIYVQNEVIQTDINYSSPGGPINHFYSRTFSTHVNPLYNADLANSLGCLMVFNNFKDFRSKYLPSQFEDQETNSPNVTVNYLWTTDATGIVVKGIGTDAIDGSIREIYTFVY